MRRLGLVAVALFLLAPAPMASAQLNEEESKRIRDADGRLRGYNETNVVLEGGDSYFGPYFAFAGLTLLATVFLFKDAKRTHLD